MSRPTASQTAPTKSVDVALGDVAATGALAARVAQIARVGDVIGLSGALGAGKTTFARAFINRRAQLADAAEEEVPSPTFTLVQIYDFATAPVYHFDLYRIENPDDVLELGIEDAFADAISLVEWPERLGPYLPAERLDVALMAGATPEARHARLGGYGNWAARVGALASNG